MNEWTLSQHYNQLLNKVKVTIQNISDSSMHVLHKTQKVELYLATRKSPGQHLKLFAMFHKSFLYYFCSVEECSILLKETTDISEYCCQEGVYFVCNDV